MGGVLSDHGRPVGVIDKARLAIYPEEDVAPIRMDLRRRFLLRSKDTARPRVRIVPRLRSMVRFARHNLMEDLTTDELMDLVFCRNVIIYFERSTQEEILDRLCRKLRPGGHIFMGHAETLHGMKLPLRSVAPMICRKTS